MQKTTPMIAMAIALSTPLTSKAQASFSTEFPAGAVALEPQALKTLLLGKVATTQVATGPVLKVTYKDTYAFLNAGNFADSGKWRVEGSSVCIDWQKITPSCTEVRAVDDAIYIKRSSNGEVVRQTMH